MHRVVRCTFFPLVVVGPALIVVVGSRGESPAPRFLAQEIDGNVQIGYGLAIGDVDGDGWEDILLADKTEFVWYRNPGAAEKPWSRFVMAENLTRLDNVCLAARDLDGDGRVEVAVGGQWNPNETRDAEESGAVFYLAPSEDRTHRWQAIPLTPHDPTVHRMHWVQWPDGRFSLAVLPLHGRENVDGRGAPVRLLLYRSNDGWQTSHLDAVDTGLHRTHNFEPLPDPSGAGEALLIAGAEGVRLVRGGSTWQTLVDDQQSDGAGEVRRLNGWGDEAFITIEPMHGHQVATYIHRGGAKWQRDLLDASLSQGHALAAADLLQQGADQVVAGWRSPNSDGKLGIRLYVRARQKGATWASHWIDENEMACEDLKVADLNQDGWLDIIAAGRATHNLRVYWNRSGKDEG